MIKDIQQTEIPLNKGIVRTPSVGSEGELSECVGLIPHAGELRVIDNPSPTSVELPEGARLVYIDNTSYGVNYIYETFTGELAYLRVVESEEPYEVPLDTSLLFSGETPVKGGHYSITSVGNCLVVTGLGFGYLLWDETKLEYRSLGYTLPQLRFQMLLSREYAHTAYKADITLQKEGNLASVSYTTLVGQYVGVMNQHKPRRARAALKSITQDTSLKIGYSYKIDLDISRNALIRVTFSDMTYVEKDGTKSITLPVQEVGGRTIIEVYVEANKRTHGDRINAYVYESDFTGYNRHVKRDQQTLDSINACLNSFLAEQHKNGKFVYPFYVRYAFRMYDGEVTCPSEPCLMIPNSGPTPRIYFKNTEAESLTVPCEAHAVASELKFRLDFRSNLALLDLQNNWKGIVKSVVFYVSPPIYTYDQSVTIADEEGRQPRVITYGSDKAFTCSGGEWRAEIEQALKEEYGKEWDSVILPPTFTVKETQNSYLDKGLFYQISEIDIEDIDLDIEGEASTLNMPSVVDFAPGEEEEEEEGVPYAVQAVDLGGMSIDPDTLVSQPRLDESSFFEPIVAANVFAYNSRTMLYDVVRFHPSGVRIDPSYQNGNSELESSVETKVYAYLNTEEGEKIVDLGGIECRKFMWWYWPDNKITQAVIVRKNEENKYERLRIEFKQHEFLPGKYWFSDLRDTDGLFVQVDDDPLKGVATADAVSQRITNRVYLSDVENPFLFRSRNSIQASLGGIIRISSAAQALSEGQYGKFPIYAFCEEGIQPFEVNQDGTLFPAQPIARDVLTNPDSVTQLDGSVVFVTERGLMEVAGRTVRLLSGDIDGYNINEDFIAPALLKFFGLTYQSDSSVIREQLQKAKIVYDYANQHLHVFLEEGKRHYVYSREDGAWAAQILEKELVSVVPGYPLSTLQLGNKLYQYTKHTLAPLQEGFALTRSLTLGNPLSRKMIADIRTIGLKTSSDTIRRIAIFGSHDNQNWFPVKSLKSGSAKYYRFLVMAKMIDTDTLTGIVCRYQERYGHKLR